MAIVKKNTYEIGVNNDLSNALLNIDLNRANGDLTYIELDGGVLKVSIGSKVEAAGDIYVVTALETPTGSAVADAYLFFDPSGPSFVWSVTPGTYDPARSGIYDASDRRQCRFRLKSATTWNLMLGQESSDVAIKGTLTVDTDLIVKSSGSFVGPVYREGLYIAGTMSADALFTALKPYVPNIGDKFPVSGVTYNDVVGEAMTLLAIERLTANVVLIHWAQPSTGTVAYLTCTDGSPPFGSNTVYISVG